MVDETVVVDKVVPVDVVLVVVGVYHTLLLFCAVTLPTPTTLSTAQFSLQTATTTVLLARSKPLLPIRQTTTL